MSTLVVMLVIGIIMAIIVKAQLAVQGRKDIGESAERDRQEEMMCNQAYGTSLHIVPTAGNVAYEEMGCTENVLLPTQVDEQPHPPMQDAPVPPHIEKVYDVCPWLG